jgi:hypothetical protein
MHSGTKRCPSLMMLHFRSNWRIRRRFGRNRLPQPARVGDYRRHPKNSRQYTAKASTSIASGSSVPAGRQSSRAVQVAVRSGGTGVEQEQGQDLVATLEESLARARARS